MEFVRKIKNIFKLTPTQIIVLGFALLVVVGGVLLALPISWQDGKSVTPINALFTSASAVCVTGLVTVDVGSTFSAFGKAVILILIQVGGLGFMSVATIFYLAFRKRITLRERMVLQESFNEQSSQGVVKLVKSVLIMTLAMEAVGALVLMTQFIPQFGVAKGILYGIFHSVSAFCNAGFDILGTDGNQFASLASYIANPVVCLTIAILIIVGGLGFAVIREIIEKRKFSKMSLHTKAVITTRAVLIFAGFIFFLATEWNNAKTIGNQSVPVKVLASFFQSVTTRTAGFSTIDQSQLSYSGGLATTMLMFIGASPASTGGGVKTSTIFIIVVMLVSIIKGKQDFEVFKRRIAHATVFRAVAIVTLAILSVIVISAVLYGIEYHNPAVDIGYKDIVFETVSAFGTVGLTQGLTPHLSSASKIILMFVMFVGRVGVMTLTFALAKRQNRPKPAIRYPEDKMMVG